MMEYFIKVNIAIALFYCFYQGMLRRSAYFAANRAFLLSGMALAFIIPAFQLPGGNYLAEITKIPAGAGLNAVVLNPVFITAEKPGLSLPDPLQWLGLLYTLIAGIFLLKILFPLFRLLQLYRNHRVIKRDGYRLVLLGKSNEPAFSFFSVIFVGAEDPNKADNWIIRHELVHVKQLHSIDIVLSEIMKALLWMNPFAYLYQRDIRSVNEYLADAIVKPEEKSRYAELMYEYSFYNKQLSLQNSFFNKTLLKRRIKMLHRKKSEKMRLAYLLIVPLLAGLVFTVSKAGNTVKTDGALEGGGEPRLIAALAQTPGETGESSGASVAFAETSDAGQSITVSGRVTDMANEPLAGTSIFLKDTQVGTATDLKGHFELKNIPSDAQLRFSMIGYEPVLIELNNSRVVNVRLSRKRQRLDEMVVVAYASRGEKDTPSEEKAASEEEAAPENKSGPIYSFASIEKMPEFPGGNEAIIKHIAKYFRYPKEARDSNTEGTIEIGFVVDKEGNVTDPEILKGLGKGCDEEALRVIKTLPRWEAGEQNGVKVAVYYVQPVVLRVN